MLKLSSHCAVTIMKEWIKIIPVFIAQMFLCCNLLWCFGLEDPVLIERNGTAVARMDHEE